MSNLESNAKDADVTKVLPKVGLVMPLASQQGGAEALFKHLLTYQQCRDRISCFFFAEGELADIARGLGYQVEVLMATRLSSPTNYFRMIKAIRRWIRGNRFDIVVAWMPKAQLYLSPAAFSLKSKVVWFQHGIPTDSTLDRIATLLPAAAVFCCSQTSLRYQEEMWPKRRSFVCYPGVLLPEAKPLTSHEARALLDLPQDVPLIGMVARLENWKGIDVLVEAAEFIFARYQNAIFFVVGGEHPLDPGYARQLREKIQILRSPDQFRLVGQKSMEETGTWQSAADVIAHPVTGIEPFGMAVPEAMARGKVVIASDEGGPSEIIEDQVSGLLVPKNAPQTLAAKIIELLEDAERRAVLQDAAVSRAQQFSIPAFVSRFSELIARVAADSFTS